MAYRGKRVRLTPEPKMKPRPARKKEEIIVEPSEFECCALGTCPQHQTQGEADAQTRMWNHLPRIAGKTYSGPFLEPLDKL